MHWSKMQSEVVSVENILELRSDMEGSLSWPINEVVTLKNLLREDNKAPIVKTLIVLLYAHFEGFVKDCLECYIQYINSTQLQVGNFSDAIIAASLSREYASFEDRNRRCKELTTVPPAEDFFHKYHRRRELTQKFMSNYLKKEIRINEKIINTKSNLDYGVLQENFYILGLDYNYFEDKQSTINKLVILRNSVAHGSQKFPIEFHEYETIEKDIVDVMSEIIRYLYEFCEKKQYLRTNF